jgi:hypothetical protein
LYGRNNVRYVSREEVEDLQTAIDGYARFNELARQDIDEIVRLPRLEHVRKHPKKARKDAASPPEAQENITQWARLDAFALLDRQKDV